SVNGPSVTFVLPPPKLTRAPLAGGVSPSSPSSTPALVRDSLYLVILATRSAGGAKSAAAFSYPLGITSIMNRIGLAPSGFGFVPGAYRSYGSVEWGVRESKLRACRSQDGRLASSARGAT